MEIDKDELKTEPLSKEIKNEYITTIIKEVYNIIQLFFFIFIYLCL